MTSPTTRLNASLSWCHRVEYEIGEGGMTTHDGHGDDLGSVGGEAAGDLRHVDVEANHHANLAEARIEDGKPVSGSDAFAVFAAGKAKLAIGSDEFAVGTQHDGGVVHLVADFLEQGGDEV